MNKPIVMFVIWMAMCGTAVHAQTDAFLKNFKQFKDLAPGIDFFAASQKEVAPFEKAARDAQARFGNFLGKDLPKGAIFICSSQEQKDAVYEPRVIKMGYRWVLMLLTPEASAQEQIARLRAQMGNELPPNILERLQGQNPEMRTAMEARLVGNTIQQLGFAILQAALAPEQQFRSSRIEDIGRLPMADWLEIGLINHAAGVGPNMGFLQPRLAEAFPLDDLLSMTRPFVAPSVGEGGGMGGLMIRTGPAGGEGAAGGPPAGGLPGGMPGMGGQGGGQGRQGGGGGRNMPKDQQDRMTFDAQAIALFNYVIEKAGMEKAIDMVRLNRQGEDPRTILTGEGFLGTDLDKIEKEWHTWIQAQKVENPGGTRIIRNPGGPGTQPQ